MSENDGYLSSFSFLHGFFRIFFKPKANLIETDSSVTFREVQMVATIA